MKSLHLYEAIRNSGEMRPNGHPLYNAASYAWRKGIIADAENFSVKSMKARNKSFGLDHVKTLSSMAVVGLVYNLGGRWKEAEDLFVQVMETSLRVLGQEHPDTLTCMANLASTFWNQGRWKEAEDLQKQELEICSRVLGAEHPDTLISMENLAWIFKRQDRYDECMELMVTCVRLREKILGVDHPYTISTAGENTTLPTRVIDVGSQKEIRPRPRLFETKGISGTYLSLSHRWGRMPKLRTTHSEVENFQSELPMDSMPATFRDAMEVTRQLGFLYLWIDSLCIAEREGGNQRTTAPN